MHLQVFPMINQFAVSDEKQQLFIESIVVLKVFSFIFSRKF